MLHFLSDNKEQPASVFSVKKILELLHIPTVLYLITIKIITGIPFGIFQSMFSLVSMEFFKLEPQQNGFVMSYVGVLSIVSDERCAQLLQVTKTEFLLTISIQYQVDK